MDVHRKRIIIASIIAVLIVLAVVYGFSPRPVPVDAAQVSRGDLRVTVEEQGKTRVRDRYTISAPVSGYLRRITLESADPVVQGMQVAAIGPARSQALDPRSRAEAEATAAAARSNLNAAREQEQAARSEADYASERLSRLRALYERKSIARDTLDQAEAEAKRAAAVLRSAQAQVGVADSELARARRVLKSYDTPASGTGDTRAVTSPVSGKVLRVMRKSEGMVAAGESLLEVGNPEDLEVEVEVLSSDAVKIRRGTPVLFERWGGAVPLEGVVRVVEPGGFTKISSLGVEEQRVIVTADITTPREVWQGLGDAYRLDVSFIVWEGKNVLKVPASAVFRWGRDWAVFVVEGGRAGLRTVKPGRSNGLVTEIISGLESGETVVAHPDDTVRDGMRVRVSE